MSVKVDLVEEEMMVDTQEIEERVSKSFLVMDGFAEMHSDASSSGSGSGSGSGTGSGGLFG